MQNFIQNLQKLKTGVQNVFKWEICTLPFNTIYLYYYKSYYKLQETNEVLKNTRIINCTIDWMKRRKGETNIHPLRRDQKTKPQGKQRLELSLASACIKPGTQRWLNVYPVETIHTAYAMVST